MGYRQPMPEPGGGAEVEAIDAALREVYRPVLRPDGLPGELPAPEARKLPPPGMVREVAERIAPRGALRHWRGDWYVYREGAWALTPPDTVHAWGSAVLSPCWFTDKDKSKPWAVTVRRLSDVLAFVALADGVRVPSDLEPPIWLGREPDEYPGERIIVLSNCRLALPSRTVLPHDPAWFSPVGLPYSYDPEARCPTWERYVADKWGDQPETIRTLRQWFGYLVSGRTDQHKALLLVGPTRSGKGTILLIMQALVGAANTAAPTAAALGSNFGLQPLIGRSLATISDLRLDRRDAVRFTERILSISGGDTLSIDRKYSTAWTGRLGVRFAIATNVVPTMSDASGAVASRFLILEMTESHLGSEWTTVAHELAAELPGILNWSLDGLDDLLASGSFAVPEGQAALANVMAAAASSVSPFLDECCRIGAGLRVPCAEMYEQYRKWAVGNGIEPMDAIRFGCELKSVVPKLRRIRAGAERTYTYEGVALA